MSEIFLEIDSRHWRRQFEKAIGRNIPKILTELVTNADDSYRRIEEGYEPAGLVEMAHSPAPIIIEFDRGKRSFAVIDNAQGLTEDDMRRRFGSYGKDSGDAALGLKTRSLFGKGLRDVLFTQHRGRVKAIRDGLFYNCEFRWKDQSGNDRPMIITKPGVKVDANLRRALRIPHNGTRVEFQLAESVHTPQEAKLFQALCHFYMLRLINVNPKRQITLKVISGRGKSSDRQLTYEFPRIDVKKNIDTEYRTEDGTMIRITGEIGLADNELSQGDVPLTDREGGVLLIDEKDSVLDLTLFGYDTDEHARRIAGLLQLHGVGAYIRDKLNQHAPEEILTESRDGFNPSHNFTVGLRNLLRPYLTPIVEQIRKDNAGIKVTLSSETQKHHRDALDLLNKLADEMLGSVGREPIIEGPKRTPPATGIAFLQSEVTAKVGIRTPLALLVNTALVNVADPISITSSNGSIQVSPGELTLGESQPPRNPAIRIVRINSLKADITGEIVAQWRDQVASATIRTTTREVITPFDGLEFEKPEYHVTYGGTRTIRLFVDTTKVPIGSQIEISASPEPLRTRGQNLTIVDRNVIVHNIACCEITVSAGDQESEGTVSARSANCATSAKIVVEAKKPNESGKHGLFKDYKFEELQVKAQSMFNEDTGFIIINVADPVNERYFTRHPTREIIQDQKHCLVRLADLILNECLQHMVARAYISGNLEIKFPNNPNEDIRRYMDEKRFQIGLQFHNLFVTKA